MTPTPYDPSTAERAAAQDLAVGDLVARTRTAAFAEVLELPPVPGGYITLRDLERGGTFRLRPRATALFWRIPPERLAAAELSRPETYALVAAAEDRGLALTARVACLGRLVRYANRTTAESAGRAIAKLQDQGAVPRCFVPRWWIRGNFAVDLSDPNGTLAPDVLSYLAANGHADLASVDTRWTCPRCGGVYRKGGTCADQHPREDLERLPVRVLTEAERNQDWYVWPKHASRPVIIKAPDADVAVYRAKRQGLEVSGTATPARAERLAAAPVCELDEALVREEAHLEEHGQDPIIGEDEVRAILQEELWTALLVDHPPTYHPRPGRPRSGPAELAPSDL